MRELKNVLVTGGAGFIGSNMIRYFLKRPDFNGRIINLDKLTYAGNLNSLVDVEKVHGNDRYFFEKIDICNKDDISKIFKKYDIDTVIHLAAESHVDRSVLGPADFIQTNILGTFNLIEQARLSWVGREDVLFHHVSTDEVYGSLGASGTFYETTAYDPRSPYSASKASSDHLVSAYYHTYGLPVTISNCSNNYGPYQFPEKLIPLMILQMLEGKSLPVYGDGKQIRDWLHVEDHCAALWTIVRSGVCGETYNVGGEAELENIVLVKKLCEEVAFFKNLSPDHFIQLINHVKDRPGHDRRYSINCDKIKNELGWRQTFNFDRGIRETVKWFLENEVWVDQIRKGSYQQWLGTNYSSR